MLQNDIDIVRGKPLLLQDIWLDSMRGKDRLGILDALLHPAILLPVLTAYQSRALGAGLPLPFPGGQSPVGSPWEHMDVQGWDCWLDCDSIIKKISEFSLP